MFVFVQRYYFEAYASSESSPPDIMTATRKNYAVELKFQAKALNLETSVIQKRSDLESFQDYLSLMFEGKYLNTFIFFPTPESLAFHFYRWAVKFWPDELVSVRVSDEPESYAEYIRNLPNE